MKKIMPNFMLGFYFIPVNHTSILSIFSKKGHIFTNYITVHLTPNLVNTFDVS